MVACIRRSNRCTAGRFSIRGAIRRRGRGDAARWGDRRRRRSVRRVDRRARGGRAARWRHGAIRRQGRADGGRHVNDDLAEAVVGLDAFDQIARRPRDARARRHAEQGAARRERHPRRLAGGGPGRGRGGRVAALPLPRRAERAHAAGADDEHPQRRQARLRLQRRHAGVHGDAGRRAVVRRGIALGNRGLPRPEERAEGAGRGARPSATRGATRRACRRTKTRSTRCWRRSARPGTSRGATW